MSQPHSPLPAYAAAVAGIALFSIMDMVMKGLTLAIGTFPTLMWRSLAGRPGKADHDTGGDNKNQGAAHRRFITPQELAKP